jgi:hypothetical protein
LLIASAALAEDDLVTRQNRGAEPAVGVEAEAGTGDVV